MDIKIIQVDLRVCVEVNGEQLPDIFSGYKINSSDQEKPELSLFIQGKLSVAVLLAKIYGRSDRTSNPRITLHNRRRT